MSEFTSNFHLLRPSWLWALVAIPLLWWLWRLHRRQVDAWRDNVDAHLLPHLLERKHSGTHGSAWLGLLAYVIAVFALAGPSWRQGEQPLWQAQAPLVVALDLSSRITASDLPPTRLLQVRAKLRQLLEARQGGQVALIAYAGEAFTVAPLTDDARNVGLFIDALQADVMPTDGQNAVDAIMLAQQLMKRAGFDGGDILLVTDDANPAALAAATKARVQGYRVSALGVGTVVGATYRDLEGRFQRANLNPASLQAMTAAGGGRYQTLAAGEQDLQALGLLAPQLNDAASQRGQKGLAWRDEGYWLLPLLMLLALFAFRRNGVAAVLLLGVCLPFAAPVQAQESSWWRRGDQQAHAKVEQGAAAYRKGDFASAEQAFAGMRGADGAYNRGNALAKQGRYDEAIAAYDQALKQQPEMEDALANRKAVEAAKKRQQQGGQGKDKSQDQDRQGQQSQGAGGKNGQADSQKPSSPSNAQDAKSQSQQQAKSADKGKAAGPPQSSSKSSLNQSQQGSGSSDSAAEPEAEKPEDARAQREADQAQKQRMQQAMGQAKGRPEKSDENKPAGERAETDAQREQRQAVEAWLRRVPDDPGSLLRAKFRLEHERRRREGR